MKKIRVLVVDDSLVFRSQIRLALEGIAEIEIVGAASNGKIALEKLTQDAVDLMTLDLEMPEMNGLETLSEIQKMNRRPKVIVFSSLSKQGAEATLEALIRGASDFILKPNLSPEFQGNKAQPFEVIRSLLLPRVMALFPEVQVESPRKTESSFSKVIWELFQPKIVVIGSSTGGPGVLEKIFSELKGPFKCPILITQHMPPLFTASLAERLGNSSGVPAREAQHLEVLEANRIYLAPGDYHMDLHSSEKGIQIQLNQGPQINFVRPAVDPLFISAARIFKEKCLGVVLTGMGEDGKLGAQEIKQMGGAVLIQSKESCVVFGMPGAVFDIGAFDKIEDVSQIVQSLKEKISE